jgi:MFS family permease
MTYSEAVRHPFFIGLIAAYILALGSQVGALSHLFRLASLRADNQIAAAAVASLAAASITGRLTGGWLLLKISARGFALTCIALQSAAMAFLAFAQTPTAILAGAVLFGLNVGNVLMMQALLLAETFGTRDYGRIYATGQMATMMGMAGGPFLVGFLYEVAGGYRTAYLAAGLISAVGCAVLALASLADRRAVRT